MSTGVLVFEDETTAVVTEAAAPSLVLIGGPTSGLRVVSRGPKGDPGEQGDPADPTTLSHTHVQAIDSTIWLIDHDLTFQPGGVTVLDETGVQHFPVVTYPATGQIQLAFNEAVAGTARLS